MRGDASLRATLAGAVLLGFAASAAEAVSLDKDGELRLGVRSYMGVRVGSQDTDGKETATILEGTFPASKAGHARQLRGFLEMALDHDLDRLVREGVGPFRLLNVLPFRVRGLAYNLVFRGEYEGVYDFGPSEYRTHEDWENFTEPLINRPLDPESIGQQRRHLRNVASHRERLFQAFLEAEVGDLFLRFGRQILVWGETDAFRLLDNINPIDSSFGGFLIALDERRVPLDMLRLNYNLGSIGPVSQAFVEGYVAVDDSVSWDPGVPVGSPWALPNAFPTNLLHVVRDGPATSFRDTRGGVQAKFNVWVPAMGDVTFGLAHYYTYLDLPTVKTQTLRGTTPGLPGVWPDDDPDGAGFPPDDVNGDGIPDRDSGALAKTIAEAPLTQITGLTATFAIPQRLARRLALSGEPVVRSELAYFHDEARFTQLGIEPIPILTTPECLGAAVGTVCEGNRRTGDSWNFVLGLDLNQYVRFLNPRQSFLISTQFFYKHLNGAAKRRAIPGVTELTGIVDGEVLPALEFIYKPSLRFGFVHNPVDQYLQTLLITTSYSSGRINPALIFIYDWYGAFAALPQLTLVRDPFRITGGYNFIDATKLRGASGVSLLRDRDNVFVQFEYTL